MRKMKYAIILLLFFVMIGYAAVSVSLSIKGGATVLSDLDDFKVYFSDVLVNGKQNLKLVNNENELTFRFTLYEIDETYEIEYDVTNGSKLFDASLSMNCTGGSSYLAVVNDFDTSDLEALGTRRGTLTLKKTKTNALEDDRHYSVTCTITASPIARDSVGEGTIIAPVKPYTLKVGDLIDVNGEKFNIIGINNGIVSMLSQKNLNATYRQTDSSTYVSFSDSNGWDYTPGPKEINIQSYSGNARTYVNEYVSYLKDITVNEDITGDLITLKQLGNLGCSISSNYASSTQYTCANSTYISWLNNGKYWWTKSAPSDYDNSVWAVSGSGSLLSSGYNGSLGIRPVISMPMSLAKFYYVKEYKIGEKVFIGDEGFNVLSDNGDTVTMLAQYNIGANYKQSETSYNAAFSNNNTWVYSPGPKEIDVQTYGSESKDLLNNYVTYLRGETGDTSLSGDLITLAQLITLGCTVNANYTESGSETCANSPYISWLNNKQYWWTRSAYPNSNGLVWLVAYERFSLIAPQGTGSVSVGVRPIITVSKKYL